MTEDLHVHLHVYSCVHRLNQSNVMLKKWPGTGPPKTHREPVPGFSRRLIIEKQIKKE